MKKLFNVENTDVETLLAMMKKDSPESFDENGELVVSSKTMYELNGQQVYIPREVIDFQKDKDVEKNRTSNGHVTVRREDAPSVFNVIMGMMGYEPQLTYVLREKEGWKPTLKKPLPRVQCMHVDNNNKQCTLTAPMGSFVCYNHGAKMKDNLESQKKAIHDARMRITNMTGDALDVIQDLIEDMDVSPQVRLKAAQDVLDRAGLKAGVDVEVNINHRVDLVAELRNSLEGMVSEPLIESDEVVEAEVIESNDVRDTSNS